MSFDLARSPLTASAIVAMLALAATVGFEGIFGGWSFIAAVLIGVVGATVLSVVTRALGLLLAESFAASLLGFVVLGGVAAGGAPTPGAYAAFFDGLVNGWARLLSSIPPAALSAEFRVVPYTVGWVATMVGCAMLRSDRRAFLAILGPIGGLVAATMLTVENRTVALGQGAVLAAGGLILGFVDHRRRHPSGVSDDHDAGGTGGGGWEDGSGDSDIAWWATATARNVGALTMASVVAASAVLVGPQLPFVDANERFDLRQFQTPPFDPLRSPTPLTQVKVGLQDANADRVVLTVSSDDSVGRLTLAVLDDYNNSFWTVADEVDAPAEFRPVDNVLPSPSDGTIAGWDRVDATIEIVDLDRLGGGEFDPPWLPMPGWPVSVTSDDRLDLRFNEGTGTVALAPDGPSSGLVYDVVAAVPPSDEDPRLADADVTLRAADDLAVPQLTSFAADTLEGADVGFEQIDAIRSRLVDRGAYDSRPASAAGRPGHSLGRLAEFVDDPERLAAFEEQYAATAASIARSEGLPARVAVGFAITADEFEERATDAEVDGAGRPVVPVFANDIVAWVEVRFDGIGWVPFDVTPPRDRAPEDAPTGQTQNEVAVPEPPPEPPPPVLPPDLDLAADLEDEDEEEIDEPEDDDVAVGAGAWRFIVAGAAATPFVLVLVAVLAILLLKRRRTARRRHATTPALRVAGAWHEVMDRMTERGAHAPSMATNRERAHGLADAEVVDADQAQVLVALADDVDRGTFHPRPADHDAALRAWERSDQLLASLDGQLSSVARLRRRLDPRPLLAPDPIRSTRDDERVDASAQSAATPDGAPEEVGAQ